MKNLIIFSCIFIFLLSSKFNPLEGTLLSDHIIVDSFMSKLLQETEAGYSIYGEKPIYLGTFCHPEYVIPGSIEHQESNLNFLALDILKRINNPTAYQGECILISRGDTLSYCHDFMIINRAAFRKAVEENILLFKMKFGKDISFDHLLDNLIATRNGFESLFQGEQALQGILLGYGVDNSISYERAFPFKYAIIFPQPKPPIAISHILDGESLAEKQQNQFSKNAQWKKITEELKDFDCHLLIKPEDHLKIFFSFHKNSSENQKLIQSYRKAQCKIDQAVLHPDFLNKTLNFFGLNSQAIQRSSEKEINELFPLEKIEPSLVLAKTLKFTFHGYITEEFLQGMQDAEKLKEEEIGLYSKELSFFDIIRRKSLSLEPFKENSRASIQFLEKLTHFCLLDKYIYINNLKQTQSEKVVTNKTESIWIHYVIQDINNNQIDGTFTFDEAKKFEIKNLIPGLAHGLIGMKEGEMREIYIHPELAYGLNSHFGNGKALQVKVQLVKIEDRQDDLNQLPPLQLVNGGISAPLKTCEDFENFRKKYSYACGFETWLHYKKAKPIVHLATLIKNLQEDTEPLSHSDRILISYLNWHIYQMR